MIALLQHLHHDQGLSFAKIQRAPEFEGMPRGTLSSMCKTGTVPRKWRRRMGLGEEAVMKYQTFDEMRTGRSEYVRVTCQDCGVQYLVHRQGAARAKRCRECDRIERNRRDRVEYAMKTTAMPHEMPVGIDALLIHVIGQAVQDARRGSRDARLWLETDGRDWLTIMGHNYNVDRVVKLGEVSE